MTLTLENVLDEFATAGFPTAAVNGHHQGLCPRCDGTITIARTDTGHVTLTCSKGCDRSRIADSLHMAAASARAGVSKPQRDETYTRTGREKGKVPSANSLRGVALGTSGTAGRFTTRKLDVKDFRPVEHAWDERLVRGVLNLLAGTEGIGKGTLLTWLIAQFTRGSLPGALHGQPARVLWVGDEDSWTQVVGPRLYGAGADLSRVEEMTAPDGRLFNVQTDADELERIITAGRFDVIVFEALLDHMPGGRGGDPTQHVRTALAPTRAVFRRTGVTALATMHTRKGASTSFRELMSGSHQYNALSRSSLLLAVHPDDKDRRLVVAGKQNYSRAAVTESFTLAGYAFELGGHAFSVPLARDFRSEPDITIDTLLAVSRTEVRDDLADEIRAVLTSEQQKLADIAGKVGRDAKDGSVRRALETLDAGGVAEKTGRGLWRLKPIGSVA